MYILGISAWYHDSSACLLKEGSIVAAAQEERFTRIKHDASFPTNSIKYCLKEANIESEEIEFIVFHEKPFLKYERLLETYLAFAPKGFKSFSMSMPLWVKDKLFQKKKIKKEINEIFGKKFSSKILFSEHHLSHAASAFFPSPFDSAAILTIDGVGEWTTTSVAIGKGNKLCIKKEIHFPHSLGLLYSAFTYYTGFRVNSGEYKIMGLAPYGKPKYYEKIKKHLIKIYDDGSFYLDMTFFNYATGLTMTNKNFDSLFDGPPRKPESKLTQREMDLAASVQKITEEIVVKIASHIAEETKEENLCLAGGVALNCVANGVLQRKKIFKNIWIQPASGDAGCALGAALAVHHLKKKYKKNKIDYLDLMKGSYLGPKYSNDEIKKALVEIGAKFHYYSTEEMIKKTAKGIFEGKAVGWMQGRMEFGPRALGSRSILGDPRSPKMQKQLNLKVKYRESFRPFAPSILSEKLSEWFELKDDSPYMLLVDYVKKEKRTEMSDAEKKLFGIEKLNISRSEVPAITHVDYSSRIQTVHKKTNPLYHALLTEFEKISGCPIVVNTSFNVRGEPIVCTPLDAFKCFMGTEMDILSIGDFILYKDEQNPKLKESYKSKYKLD